MAGSSPPIPPIPVRCGAAVRRGSRVWLRDSGKAERKYPLSWELVEAEPGILVGINTGLSNLLVEEGIARGMVKELPGYRRIRREVRYGLENSRIDLLLEEGNGPSCYVEVKNVTLVEEGSASFPDAVSARGSKHLRELAQMVRQGHRAVIFYCVQRSDAREVSPADRIDPVYGQTLRQVMAEGVEALAYAARVTPQGIELSEGLPVVCREFGGDSK
ncbi:MAG: DNA/RNA nuclease SfsA [Methylococcaceae bacterium]|nr:DNA/RNA nuclease SfsA [Methylococcaceae bacterium]